MVPPAQVPPALPPPAPPPRPSRTAPESVPPRTLKAIMRQLKDLRKLERVGGASSTAGGADGASADAAGVSATAGAGATADAQGASSDAAGASADAAGASAAAVLTSIDGALDRGDLSAAQKVQISAGVLGLKTSRLDQAIKIIRERNPSMVPESGELEIDFGTMDSQTLWRLHDFLGMAVASTPSSGAAAAEEYADFSVTLPDEANVLCWRVEMSVPSGSALRSALDGHGDRYNVRPTIEMEVTFGPDFPSTPPFVRVVAPRFAFHTGHVTVGGSICMELLTTSGWNSEYTVESVLVSVRQAMLDGGGSLHPSKAQVPYHEDEARAAFDRVARQHGWKP